jgi:hypothetical protein
MASESELEMTTGAEVTVRQARLDVVAKARRCPSLGWEAVLASLACKKAAELQKQAGRLA